MQPKKTSKPAVKQDQPTETPKRFKQEPVLVQDERVPWNRVTQRKRRAPGFEYVSRGNSIIAKTSNDTVSAVRAVYPIFGQELDEVRKYVRANRNVSLPELQKAFESSEIARAADDVDWQIWIEDFVQPRGSAKAKSHALTLLKRKTGLEISTIKTYLKHRD